jgi:hypothetical protein
MSKAIAAGSQVLHIKKQLENARERVRELERQYDDAQKAYLQAGTQDLEYINCLIGNTLIVPEEGAWDCKPGNRLQFFDVDERESK